MSPDVLVSQAEKQVLTELKTKLAGLLGDQLESLRIFGSRARGDAESNSDLDVVILVRSLSRRQKRQILDLVAELELEHLSPISVLVMSTDQFEQLKGRERRIALDIEKEGIPF
ncbi:nucleotidyltransferase domain-containing protein [Acidobacteria bacterium AH-259-D05]|nr:nucleotidyltransferase domain-containing protein [Acidobacteria bacterium AH-259-D05]